MICTQANSGVAGAAVMRTAWTFEDLGAHLSAANAAARAGAAIAPQRKRRPAAATIAFVNRGSS